MNICYTSDRSDNLETTSKYLKFSFRLAIDRIFSETNVFVLIENHLEMIHHNSQNLSIATKRWNLRCT